MNLVTLNSVRSLYRNILVTFAGVLLSTTAFTQRTAVTGLTEKFDQYRKGELQEKIYVHLDRTFYLTGETMWFKLYLVDGSFHTPLNLSKVAYIEIVKDQIPVLQAKIEMKDGTGNGSLFIPATLSSGNYVVRSYTNWMKNSSPDFFFHQPITLVNTFKSIEPRDRPVPTKINAQFFPEGGNLVDGLPSKVAFKVTNVQGDGIPASGVIVNEKGDSITTFKSLKYGMGNFTITPSMLHAYRALIKGENGIISSFTLPAIYPDGYVMTLTDQKDELLIRISSKNSLAENIFLFAHSRQVITNTEVQSLVNGTATFTIRKNSLRDGINHLTIFNQSLQPVCERLFFIKPDAALEVTISASQQEYGTRRKVVLDITTTQGKNKKPVQANLSLSVFKADSLPAVDRAEILSYLYLTSDLTGSIESPGYYFSNNDQFVEEATDNLMLTHGWRRFNWDTVLNPTSKQERFYPEYRGHIIHGVVKDLSAKPTENIETYLAFPGRNIRLYLSRSDRQGLVKYEMRNFYGPQKVVAQTNANRDSTFTIEIKSPFSDKFSEYPNPEFQLSPSLEKSLVNRALSMQVQNVFSEEPDRFKTSIADSSAFYGKADETYFLDDFTRFPVMEEVMREYVKGVFVRKRKDGFHFLVFDNINHSVFETNPLVLLDGVPAFNVNEIMDLNPAKVKKLEILTRKYYLGDQSFPGIVSYTSFEGDMAGFQLDPKTLTLDYEGLQLQREFYSPPYENERQRLSRKPDHRTLLHWAPDVVTTNGKAHVEFYTSDLDGSFTVIAEGLSAKGEAGSAVGQLKVIPKQK